MVDYGKFKNYFFKGIYEELNVEFLEYVFGSGEDFENEENFGLEMFGMMLEGFEGVFDSIGFDKFIDSLNLYIGFCNILYDIFKLEDFNKVISYLEKCKKFYLKNVDKLDKEKLLEKVENILIKGYNIFCNIENKLNIE